MPSYRCCSTFVRPCEKRLPPKWADGNHLPGLDGSIGAIYLYLLAFDLCAMWSGIIDFPGTWGLGVTCWLVSAVVLLFFLLGVFSSGVIFWPKLDS